MSIVEVVSWSFCLLLALGDLALIVVYRTIRRRQSGDDHVSRYEKAIALDPNWAAAYSMCGLARAWQGEHRAAIADYDRALELDPSDAAAHMSRGLAYQQLGDAEMALTDSDQAVALSPDDPIIRLSRLKLHQAFGNNEAALADLKHVMELSPEFAEEEPTKNLLSELQKPSQ
jgi:tetratricopeptide (TPR) repeat protein